MNWQIDIYIIWLKYLSYLFIILYGGMNSNGRKKENFYGW